MSEAIGTREFAEKYGVTQATVSKWCREGKIPNCNQVQSRWKRIAVAYSKGCSSTSWI